MIRTLFQSEVNKVAVHMRMEYVHAHIGNYVFNNAAINRYVENELVVLDELTRLEYHRYRATIENEMEDWYERLHFFELGCVVSINKSSSEHGVYYVAAHTDGGLTSVRGNIAHNRLTSLIINNIDVNHDFPDSINYLDILIDYGSAAATAYRRKTRIDHFLYESV